MGKSWLAKGAARPVFGQPSSDRTLENCPAPAAAREQHDERHSGAQPDRSLQGKIHFVFSFRGMGFPVLVTGYFCGTAAEVPGNQHRESHTTKGENEMYLALQGAVWLGAGVTLVMLLSRRRRRRTVL